MGVIPLAGFRSKAPSRRSQKVPLPRPSQEDLYREKSFLMHDLRRIVKENKNCFPVVKFLEEKGPVPGVVSHPPAKGRP